MDAYEVFLFGHLLGAIAWVGTNIGLTVLTFRVKSRGPEATMEFARDVNWLGVRMQVPAALLTVLFGFLLVNELGYSLGEAWISFALAVYLLSFFLGAGFLGPESGRIAAIADERGPTDPEAQRRLDRVLLLGRIELVLLVLVVLDMVVKPGA